MHQWIISKFVGIDQAKVKEQMVDKDVDFVSSEDPIWLRSKTIKWVELNEVEWSKILMTLQICLNNVEFYFHKCLLELLNHL
jgi:hypothetical protein